MNTPVRFSQSVCLAVLIGIHFLAYSVASSQVAKKKLTDAQILTIAFGPDSDESRMPIIFRLSTNSTESMIFACNQADVAEEGWLYVRPFHFARLDAKGKVIQRVVAKEAHINWEQKLKFLSDMKENKIQTADAFLANGEKVTINLRSPKK